MTAPLRTRALIYSGDRERMVDVLDTYPAMDAWMREHGPAQPFSGGAA